MSQIRLVLADTDSVFLEKFSAYLLKNKTTRFFPELFTSPSKYEEWCEKGGHADMMVLSSTFFSLLTSKPGSKNVIILSDGPESILPEGYETINKYRPAEILMKEILSQCSETIPQRAAQEKKTGKISLVLYVDGSDVLNPLSYSIALLKAANHRTFYLSLDELPNTDLYFSSTNSKGLSEMLYYIKAKKENLPLKAEACTSKDFQTGVDFMKCHQNPLDMGNLTDNELDQLLEAIRNRGCYEDLVVTRAFRCDELLRKLVKEASKIYLTALEYRSSIFRLKKACDLLTDMYEEYRDDLYEKVLLCITLIHQGQNVQLLETEPYQKAYLPFPFSAQPEAMVPSNEYLCALDSILDK